jgi:hypothetical protein
MEFKNLNFLKLTIEPQKNELVNIKLIEKIPTDILNLLINSSLLKDKFNIYTTRIITTCCTSTTRKNTY